MRISDTTEQERNNYGGDAGLDNTLASGVVFNHRKTIRKINTHKRGEFFELTNKGSEVFWPLGMHRAVHFAKHLDPDPKYFKVQGYGDKNVYQSWLINIRYRRWALDTAFGEDLDDFGDAAADFGSVALKLVEDEDGRYDLQECDLLKLWFDPTIKSFENNTKIELHELARHQVLGKEGWDNSYRAWDMGVEVDYAETYKSDTINVVEKKRKFWERVGWFNIGHYEGGNVKTGKYIEEYEYTEDKGVYQIKKDANGYPVRNKDFTNNWKFLHTIHSSSGVSEVVVFAEEIDPKTEDIYIDLHISKYEDRWLRVGVYERLFQLQGLGNETVNYNREAQQIASLLLFRTKNKRWVGSNILEQAKSGLITDQDLEQIGINNTFLNDFVATMQTIEAKADRICLTPDVITGEDPGATTFRGQKTLTLQAKSAFKKSRDRILRPIAKILTDRILPEEVKDWNKEKTIEISGFDIDVRMYDALVPMLKLEEFISEEFTKGRNPSEEEKKSFIQTIQAQIEREGRKFDLPENFFNFKFGLIVDPAEQFEDRERMNDAYNSVITWILTNPAVNFIPAFREYCEKNGVTPFHLTPDQMAQMQQGATSAPPKQPSNQERDLSPVGADV